MIGLLFCMITIMWVAMLCVLFRVRMAKEPLFVKKLGKRPVVSQSKLKE